MNTTYIAFLRGINVGGKNSIKMAELKKMFEGMGFQGVQTYIQSGNVIFESEDDEEFLHKAIEQKINAVFGLEVKVILRTVGELEQIIANCPFSEEKILEAETQSKVESLYVAMLEREPLQEGIAKFGTYKSGTDDFCISGRDVYLLFFNSIRNSKLANGLDKLGIPSTVRNWKTLNKLVSMAADNNER